jgi:hypothetical protein
MADAKDTKDVKNTKESRLNEQFPTMVFVTTNDNMDGDTDIIPDCTLEYILSTVGIKKKDDVTDRKKLSEMSHACDVSMSQELSAGMYVNIEPVSVKWTGHKRWKLKKPMVWFDQDVKANFVHMSMCYHYSGGECDCDEEDD